MRKPTFSSTETLRYRSWMISAVMCLCFFQSVAKDNLLPRADSPFWRDSIPVTMRQSYIQYGEQYLGKSWKVLPYSVFSEFRTNGNRVNYEGLNFEKRRQFAAIVMAEIMEGKGRFINDIINGMGSFCEETWWGIPAHYGKKIPVTEDQTVDLFNAETASLVAWTAFMLKPQFDKLVPELYGRVGSEIKRRILEPALSTDYWWKKAGMNWNPWICSNWLTCVLIFEDDSEKREDAISQIVNATQAFIDSYPEDGGCDEGPGYWDRAAASMFEILRLLPEKQKEAVLGVNRNKIEAMASYAYKTYIGHDYCVNFADAHENKAIQQVNIVYPFGRWLGDATMCGFGAYLAKQKNVLDNPAALYDKSGNFPTLGRELMFLRDINNLIAETPREPVLNDTWFDNLQIMTARRGNLFLAMKGGTNGESHNHNDVGSFIVYADNEPLFIDPGVGEYTSKTFSNERYSIWTMQSQYHNLPQINGVDQKDGKQFAAKVINHKNGMLTLDIAGAYPEKASVKSWKRTVAVAKSGISVTEVYELDVCREPARLMLLTVQKPEIQGGKIMLGRHSLVFDTKQIEAKVEDISGLLDPLLQTIWGRDMYRIVLTAKTKEKLNQLKYHIR